MPTPHSVRPQPQAFDTNAIIDIVRTRKSDELMARFMRAATVSTIRSSRGSLPIIGKVFLRRS